ncbi:MAG: ankyrin repeat domain-containing protein [Haliscomenobacteraceae bacterium CHB4]|nr:ankyrin repeat domain-containing protein [Haliscomenobacteraceae bacterium CHB4]
MNLLKIITLLNWLIIAILAFLVIAETISPAKGGDAAGKGMGQAIYYLAIIALVVLVGLNLLPYNWAKYTAFALVALPVVFIQVAPSWRKLKRNVSNMIEEAKPIFPDKERDRIARAIYDGKPEKVRELLQTPLPNLNENGELLAFAINAVNHSGYKPEERMECLKLLFQAGAKLDSVNRSMEVPIHMAVADVGNAALLRLLLENGADANARHRYFKRHILFEAIGSHGEPEATVRALLDYGADPKTTAVFDEAQGPVTPLWRAAEMGRWGVCAALLEKGADPDIRRADGTSFRAYLQEAEKDFVPDGYSTREDLERLRNALK